MSRRSPAPLPADPIIVDFGGGRTCAMTLGQLAAATGQSLAEVRADLRRAVRLGYLRRRARGHYQAIVPGERP